jgi:hypothetical protein
VRKLSAFSHSFKEQAPYSFFCSLAIDHSSLSTNAHSNMFANLALAIPLSVLAIASAGEHNPAVACVIGASHRDASSPAPVHTRANPCFVTGTVALPAEVSATLSSLSEVTCNAKVSADNANSVLLR